jgi:hypothetical protein
MHALQVTTLIVVSVALAPVLAHVLELPDKLRLDKNAYQAERQRCMPRFRPSRLVRRLPAGVIANSHVCASGQTSHNPDMY